MACLGGPFMVVSTHRTGTHPEKTFTNRRFLGIPFIIGLAGGLPVVCDIGVCYHFLGIIPVNVKVAKNHADCKSPKDRVPVGPLPRPWPGGPPLNNLDHPPSGESHGIVAGETRHVTPTVLQCVTTLRSVVWTLQQRRLNDSVFHRACFWISKPPMTWDPVILRYANFPTSIIFFLKIFCQFGVALNSVTWTNTFHENLPFPEIRLWVNPTWRIIPLSKELATPIYKTFGQFGRGPTTPRIGE